MEGTIPVIQDTTFIDHFSYSKRLILQKIIVYTNLIYITCKNSVMEMDIGYTSVLLSNWTAMKLMKGGGGEITIAETYLVQSLESR